MAIYNVSDIVLLTYWMLIQHLHKKRMYSSTTDSNFSSFVPVAFCLSPWLATSYDLKIVQALPNGHIPPV